jgi:uncharacterized HAD superfamily protein
MHRWAKVCGHCEDQLNLVRPDNGLSVIYNVTETLEIDIFLHHSCAAAWSRQFNIPVPIVNSQYETRILDNFC